MKAAMFRGVSGGRQAAGGALLEELSRRRQKSSSAHTRRTYSAAHTLHTLLTFLGLVRVYTIHTQSQGLLATCYNNAQPSHVKGIPVFEIQRNPRV